MYDIVWRFLRGDVESRKEFVYCHRRYGKSFVVFLVSTEVGLGKALEIWQTTKRIIRFMAPTMQDLEEIYLPIAEDLFETCPEELRPIWRTSRGRGHFYFPSTGSQLYLFGVDAKHYRKARGKVCHLAVPDEVGSCEPGHPGGIEHVVNAILMPQTFGVNGRIIMPTTPAETPAHPSVMLRAQCEAAGAFVKRRIQDTEKALERHFGAGIVDEYARECGGRETTTFRREYECEEVVDETAAVLPEFGAVEASMVAEWKRPLHWEPYEAMDPGFSPSQTAVLFGYYDFLAAKLVIEDELMLSRMRTDELAEGVKAKELGLWAEKATEEITDAGPTRRVDVPHRWSDIDAILLNDLAVMHRLAFAPTSKDTLDAMVNKARVWVKADRLRIHPRCKSLVAQLKSAVWNKSRTEFAYSGAFGHYDGVAALVYMIRNCPETRNPYPAIPDGVTSPTHFISPALFKPTGNAGALEAMFASPRKRT